MDRVGVNQWRGGPARRWVAAGAVAALACASIGGAAAMPACEGSYAATLIQPLPTPMVVGLDIRDDSPANRRMADRFLAGLGEAGIAVGTPPTVLLHITSYRRGGTLAQSGGEAESDYSDLSALKGGLRLGLPGMPNAARPPPAQPLLILRIEATEAASPRTAWVASVQCRIVGTDDGERAQEMGKVIGGALGQRVERRPL